jgi:branched-chain amino acid transport system substrate-binding protein
MVQSIRYSSQPRPGQVKGRSEPFLPFAFFLLTLVFPACPLSLFSVRCFAQEPKPYATLDHNAVSYNGPGRDAAHDLTAAEIRIGLLLPLAGPYQVEGEALKRAAQMAVDEENASSLPCATRLRLVARDESGPWGQASSEIVHMVFDDQVVAIITGSNGGAAHRAEQVANKIGVPILTMSTDTTTTEINLPWIFRLGPTDADEAGAFGRDVYQVRKFERVALLTQDDHDGREGGEEFEHTARRLKAPAPVRIVVPLVGLPARELQAAMERTQAVVIWTDAPGAIRLVGQVREVLTAAPIYICRKAVLGDWARSPCNERQIHCSEDARLWMLDAPLAGQNPATSGFERKYFQHFGVKPGLGAAQAYDAVRVLAAALRHSGPNRTRLRDSLAGLSGFKGASGVISFDRAGNSPSTFTTVHVP